MEDPHQDRTRENIREFWAFFLEKHNVINPIDLKKDIDIVTDSTQFGKSDDLMKNIFKLTPSGAAYALIILKMRTLFPNVTPIIFLEFMPCATPSSLASDPTRRTVAVLARMNLCLTLFDNDGNNSREPYKFDNIRQQIDKIYEASPIIHMSDKHLANWIITKYKPPLVGAALIQYTKTLECLHFHFSKSLIPKPGTSTLYEIIVVIDPIPVNFTQQDIDILKQFVDNYLEQAMGEFYYRKLERISMIPKFMFDGLSIPDKTLQPMINLQKFIFTKFNVKLCDKCEITSDNCTLKITDEFKKEEQHCEYCARVR